MIKIKKNRFFSVFSVLLLAIIFLIPANSHASGLKQLYITGNTYLSRTPPSIKPPLPQPVIINSNDSYPWVQTPALQSAVTIDPTVNSDVPVNLYINTNSNYVYLYITLSCSGGGSITLKSPRINNNSVELFTFNIPLNNTSIKCAAGDTWTLTIKNTPYKILWFDFGGPIDIYPVHDQDLSSGIVNGEISQVLLPTQDVIKVDSVEFYDAPYPNGNLTTSFSPHDTIYIRSTISDPFGSFDIFEDARLTLTDAGGTEVVTPPAEPTGNMTKVNDSGAATKTYEYSYTVPTFPAQGTWTAKVESFEGTEGTISAISQATFQVISAAPQLTILKSANSATASPGQVITYSVIITNSGGPATNVVIDDDISPYTAWGLDSFGSSVPFSLTQIAPGSPADSGLTIGTAVYYDENNTVMTPTSNGGGAGAGFDGRVNRFELPMNGTMVPGGQFKLEYKVKVK